MTPEATKAAQQIAAETGLTVDQVVERSLLLVATLRALVWLRGPMGERGTVGQ